MLFAEYGAELRLAVSMCLVINKFSLHIVSLTGEEDLLLIDATTSEMLQMIFRRGHYLHWIKY